jgi:hypothetical protein
MAGERGTQGQTAKEGRSMHRCIGLILCVLATWVSAQAQPNWQGILFGATAEQIAASPLKPEKLAKREVSPHGRQYVDYRLKNYEIARHQFAVSFFMGTTSDKLEEVSLATTKLTPVDGEVLCDSISQTLSGKYSRPVAASDKGDRLSRTVNKRWRGDGVSVQLACLISTLPDSQSAYVMINCLPLTGSGDASKL